MTAMRTLRWSGVVVCALVAVTACTVERTPGAGSSPPAASAGAPSGRPCPWSEERGQEYEPETGRIRLVVACLGVQHRTGDGGGRVYGGPDGSQGDGDRRYADGTTAAVLCVEPAGGRFADSAGHGSTVWFQVDGAFADGSDGTGWVPHAATGYASTAGQDACPPR
jgi:hypothetical protein